MNTIFELRKYALQQLKDTYNNSEINFLTSIIFSNLLGYTNIEIHLKKHEIISESIVLKFYDAVNQLKTNKPIQYVIGETVFAGLTFRVNENTLIPRPETEELVMIVTCSGIKANDRILDVGTGSGCIAIALAHLTGNENIEGIDISSDAIEMARFNAAKNNVTVRFEQADILNYGDYIWPEYDVIVSNPPYVRNSEKVYMHSRVLDYEPHNALFVEDSDPLLFYRTIAEFAKKYLKKEGRLFFEINEALGKEMTELLSDLAFEKIEVKKDINERDRFVHCIKA